jgi:hypothetical protein
VLQRLLATVTISTVAQSVPTSLPRRLPSHHTSDPQGKRPFYTTTVPYIGFTYKTTSRHTRACAWQNLRLECCTLNVAVLSRFNRGQVHVWLVTRSMLRSSSLVGITNTLNLLQEGSKLYASYPPRIERHHVGKVRKQGAVRWWLGVHGSTSVADRFVAAPPSSQA